MIAVVAVLMEMSLIEKYEAESWNDSDRAATQYLSRSFQGSAEAQTKHTCVSDISVNGLLLLFVSLWPLVHLWSV